MGREPGQGNQGREGQCLSGYWMETSFHPWHSSTHRPPFIGRMTKSRRPFAWAGERRRRTAELQFASPPVATRHGLAQPTRIGAPRTLTFWRAPLFCCLSSRRTRAWGRWLNAFFGSETGPSSGCQWARFPRLWKDRALRERNPSVQRSVDCVRILPGPLLPRRDSDRFFGGDALASHGPSEKLISFYWARSERNCCSVLLPVPGSARHDEAGSSCPSSE